MVSTALRIKELLRQRQWTTKVLAEKTGLSESYLTHMKNGTRRWNEDALRKLARAFEVSPTEMLACQKSEQSITQPRKIAADQESLSVVAVPVLTVLPHDPSWQANRDAQAQSGTVGQFVPMIDRGDEALFCYQVAGNELAPVFTAGNLLIVSPQTWVRSGDIGAIEWRVSSGELMRGFRRVTFMDEFIVLDALDGKTAPIALVRSRDHFRSLGKLIFRYQNW